MLRATGRPCQRPIGLGPTSLTEIEAGNRVPDPRPLGRCGGLVPLVGSMARLGSLLCLVADDEHESCQKNACAEWFPGSPVPSPQRERPSSLPGRAALGVDR